MKGRLPVVLQSFYELFSGLDLSANYFESVKEVLIVKIVIVLDSIAEVENDWFAHHLILEYRRVCSRGARLTPIGGNENRLRCF